MKNAVLFADGFVVRTDLIGWVTVKGERVFVEVPGSQTLTIDCDGEGKAQSVFRQIREKMVEVVS